MFLLFALLASVITDIGVIRVIDQIWFWRVIFMMLTEIFIIITFLILCSWVWWRCLWWRCLTMMVLGPGSLPVRAFLHILNYQLIVLVDYFRFPLKNFSSFKFRILNMITVCCRFVHSFKIMRITQPGIPEVIPPRPVQALSSGRGGEIEDA